MMVCRGPGLVAILLLVAMTGCQSTYYTHYISPNREAYDASAGIAGLPLLENGAPLSAETQHRHEACIDQALSGVWTSRYVAIGQLRNDHATLMEECHTSLTGNCNLESRLKIYSGLCKKLQQASGCRYAVVPTYGAASWSDVHVLSIAYIIPAVPIIIFGTAPIQISERPGTRVPAFTMALVDLEKTSVLAEEVLAIGNDFDPETSEYPLQLLHEMGPIELQVSGVQVRSEEVHYEFEQ
ncbi:MAG TPA: hypothetical protein DCZ95_11935 [Verrucomicrobia bacterium]|nr:MAG: hypothetical protein A2X46_13980 [Lentisphaerae bacterium GWF2_57_35]HBA84795.1 hypothetical protein [Verrucomicrobiota bacterium]